MGRRVVEIAGGHGGWGAPRQASWLCVVAALAALACGEATPKSGKGGASAGSSGAAGTTGDGDAAGDSGLGGGGPHAGSTAVAGSSSGGSSRGGSSNGGRGGMSSGGGATGGAGVGEQVCSSDAKSCFEVVHQQWPGTGNAGVDGVAFDSEGDVVVAASTLGGLAPLNPSGAADFLVKWSPTLQFVSAQQQLGISRSLALDASDNAFRAGVRTFDPKVTGTSGLDLSVTKTSPDGTELWSKPVGSMLYDDARGMATDADGNCYIGGFTFGQFADDPNLGGGDALVVKLAPNGDQLWAHQFGSNDFDGIEGICTDAAGNAYVTGSVTGTLASPGQGDEDLFVAKLSPSGERLWTKQLGSAGTDGGTGVACGADFIYVVGITTGRLDDPQAAAPADTDIVLLKYDSAGTQLWLEQWLTADEERYPKIAVGLKDEAVVAGATATDLDGVLANGPGGATDLFLGSWSSSGKLLWTYQWGSSSWDTAMGIAISPTGRIAVGALAQTALPQFASLGSGGAVLSVFTPQ
ncbi:MAG: hypothetical protein ABUL60_07185 [Myxococcales bacterium]